MYNKTIVGIATPLASGAISIIRLSGKDAISIVNKLFTKDLTKSKANTITYGHIINENFIVDEVLVSVFKAPKTFTREDIVEINCHGGVYVTKKIVELLVLSGATLAKAGEFSQRAFLNGRIDLTKAESIMDIIEAKNDNQLFLATKALSGNVTDLVNNLREDLIQIIGLLEVNIDYPEYDDIEVLTNDSIMPKIENLITKMQNILEESKTSKIIKEGINTAIIGKPNVGKSSLLNLLLEEEKAIVTEIEGTTRDLVEGKINLDGLILNLIDTAGIRDTTDIVEQIGIERSLSQIEKADLILLVLDMTRNLDQTDQLLLDKTKDKSRIVILNKLDEKVVDLGINDGIEISTISKTNVKELKMKILEKAGVLNYDPKGSYLSNIRHITNIKLALQSLETAKEASTNFIPLDLVLIDLFESLLRLDEILGQNQTNLIDELFKRFCLGK